MDEAKLVEKILEAIASDNQKVYPESKEEIVDLINDAMSGKIFHIDDGSDDDCINVYEKVAEVSGRKLNSTGCFRDGFDFWID